MQKRRRVVMVVLRDILSLSEKCGYVKEGDGGRGFDLLRSVRPPWRNARLRLNGLKEPLILRAHLRGTKDQGGEEDNFLEAWSG